VRDERREGTTENMKAPALSASPIALLLVDVVNPMDFEGAEDLLPVATRASERIARLKRRAREADVATIYVNDNFDCWHLGFRELVEKFEREEVPGLSIIRRLEPEPQSDFYILKPSQSGFFRSGLEELLDRLASHTLVVAGFATDACVFFTAADAHMRGFHLIVARDCVAAEREADHEQALRQMKRILKAEIVDSESLDLTHLDPPSPSKEARSRRAESSRREVGGRDSR
jgi:nicotinamidase-related amidase